jgi:hypothetical protein
MRCLAVLRLPVGFDCADSAGSGPESADGIIAAVSTREGSLTSSSSSGALGSGAIRLTATVRLRSALFCDSKVSIGTRSSGGGSGSPDFSNACPSAVSSSLIDSNRSDGSRVQARRITPSSASDRPGGAPSSRGSCSDGGGDDSRSRITSSSGPPNACLPVRHSYKIAPRAKMSPPLSALCCSPLACSGAR